MKFSYKVTLDEIDELIKGLEEYKQWLSEKCQQFVDRLAQQGLQVASARFQVANYSGTNDVTVRIEKRGNMYSAVVAEGDAVLFIEFGTGVTYPDGHPDKPPEVSPRGTYGYGLGKMRDGWRYPIEKGIGNSDAEIDSKHRNMLRTKGNPSNMSMYNSVRELEEEFAVIAREVFK